MITAFSSVVLLLLGVLSGTPAATGTAREETEEPAPPIRPVNQEDVDIMARLEGFLVRDPVHLDPNLTLSRLAKRLQLPEKRLSAAVNRATGANVSRYINGWRIRYACDQIAKGATVTDAMLDSGFNTKSNFNREFLRETGVSPSQWKQTGQSVSNVTPLTEANRNP